MAAIEQQNIISPGVGERARIGGMEATFKVAAEQTGGAFSMVEFVVEPRALVPPHVHENKNEVSYVTEGELGFMLGDEDISAPAEDVRARRAWASLRRDARPGAHGTNPRNLRARPAADTRGVRRHRLTTRARLRVLRVRIPRRRRRSSVSASEKPRGQRGRLGKPSARRVSSACASNRPPTNGEPRRSCFARAMGASASHARPALRGSQDKAAPALPR